LSHLLSKVTDTSCSFYAKCTVCPPWCWTTDLDASYHTQTGIEAGLFYSSKEKYSHIYNCVCLVSSSANIQLY